MTESGFHRPSRVPLVLAAVVFTLFYSVVFFWALTGHPMRDGGAVWYILPFFFLFEAVPMLSNWVRTGPEEVVVRNIFWTRRIPTADIVSLGVRPRNERKHLVITYQDKSGKTRTYSFRINYASADVAAIVEEIRSYNARVALDKDLTRFMEKVAEARLAGKPLPFLGFIGTVGSFGELAKFWWILPLFLAVLWLLRAQGISG